MCVGHPVRARVTRARDGCPTPRLRVATVAAVSRPASQQASKTYTVPGQSIPSLHRKFAAESLEPRRLLSSAAPGDGVYTPTDLAFLDDVEHRAVQFFYDETNPSTGLVPDAANANGGGASAFSSIAAI